MKSRPHVSGADPSKRCRIHPAQGADLPQRKVPDNSSAARRISPAYALQPQRTTTHHALDDAIAQAEIFEALLERRGKSA